MASEDMDSLTFGASRFLRQMMDHRSKKIPVMEFKMAKVLEKLSLTMDQFIDLCILSGCDYCHNIKGIGGVTVLKLIRQHGSIETILENMNKERSESFIKPVATDLVFIKRKGNKCILGFFKQGNRTRIQLTKACLRPKTETCPAFLLPSATLNSKHITSSFQVLHCGA